jgi:hypothetical protein
LRRAIALTGAALSGVGLLAACGSSGGATGTLADAYTNTLNAGSATVGFVEKITASGHSETVSASGVTSFTSHTENITSTDNGATSEVRYVGNTLYLKLPPSESKGLGAGKSWASVDLARLAGSTNPIVEEITSLGSESGTSFLGFLKAVTSVRKVGTATVNGAPATAYDAMINLGTFATKSGLPAALTKTVTQELGRTGTFPLKLWVDVSDRVVRETFQLVAHPVTSSATTAAVTVLAEVSLSHFGQPLHVAAPPASETRDITSTFAGASTSPSPSPSS